MNRYEDLDEPYETELEKGYPSHSCDIDAQFIKFDDGTFDLIESFESQYQVISMYQDETNRDTCMDLDNTMQICGSYRPHYHEYMVHQTARFLPKDNIKRVLFVGGGDSMLLHETLKYPSLELVVGLELDQKVTRGCFKHFGTQPHFDDDRVEWWFGDAAKSLLMLPKDYFASFDLVLVDLSETVMSFSVSKELTVLEALTLLVKPDGIFVKNEVYFEEFQEMFPYTALVTWYVL
jgi:spermidine synthase